MSRTIEEIKADIQSLRLGILMNFPQFCGEERTKEAINTLNELTEHAEQGFISNGITTERHAEICQAERENRLVVLHFKVSKENTKRED